LLPYVSPEFIDALLRFVQMRSPIQKDTVAQSPSSGGGSALWDISGWPLGNYDPEVDDGSTRHVEVKGSFASSGSEPLIETIRQRDTLWIGGSTNVSWTNKAASGRATPDGDQAIQVLPECSPPRAGNWHSTANVVSLDRRKPVYRDPRLRL
jgi:hypothetical protein